MTPLTKGDVLPETHPRLAPEEWLSPAFITKHTLPQQGQRSEEQATRASVTIPYIHGLSQSTRRVLSSLAIKVTFHPLRTLRQELVHPKDPIPEWQRSPPVCTCICTVVLVVFLLITDEDNWRLPKRLEINFIYGPVLSSNLSIRYEIIFHSNNIIVVRYSWLLHSCILPTNR